MNHVRAVRSAKLMDGAADAAHTSKTWEYVTDIASTRLPGVLVFVATTRNTGYVAPTTMALTAVDSSTQMSAVLLIVLTEPMLVYTVGLAVSPLSSVIVQYWVPDEVVVTNVRLRNVRM